MHFLGVAISALTCLAVTGSSTTEVNGKLTFPCRYRDGITLEVECTLGNFNNESDVIRTLNVNLPHQKILESYMLPRIRAARLIIQAPYLRYIDDNSFAGFEDYVLFLKITNGSLRAITPAIIKLHRLKTLNLDGNGIRSIDRNLEGMTSLRQLVLSNNQISTIDKHSLNSDLNAVNLMSNRIESLNGSLAYKSSLRWLFIARNKIYSLSGELDGMKSLQILDASWNNIKDIAWASLNLPSLQIMDLSHNAIYVLGNGLNGLPKLRSLDLSNNRLAKLDEDNFLNLRSLQELNLSENRLWWLDERAFDCLTKLTTLDLSLNRMKELNVLVSPDGSALKDVLFSISPNVPEESTEEICDFRLNTPLKTLNLTGNIWKCESLFIQSLLRLQKKNVKLIGNPC